jgi:hypothetical protein
MDSEEMKPYAYSIIRILGNDLVPRHGVGQTLANLKFTLENESDFANCKKLWLVNRIIDKECEMAVISLLDKHNQTYKVLPFETEHYQLSWTRYEKLRYIVKLNNARNFAVSEGRRLSKWIFPLDGNVFIPDEGWKNITFYLDNLSNKLFKITMHRINYSNDEVFTFDPKKYESQEPQVIFRDDNFDAFDENLAYANSNKEEFLLRFPHTPYLNYVIRLNDFTQGYNNDLRREIRLKAIPIVVSLVDEMVAIERTNKSN